MSLLSITSPCNLMSIIILHRTKQFVTGNVLHSQAYGLPTVSNSYCLDTAFIFHHLKTPILCPLDIFGLFFFLGFQRITSDDSFLLLLHFFYIFIYFLLLILAISLAPSSILSFLNFYTSFFLSDFTPCDDFPLSSVY